MATRGNQPVLTEKNFARLEGDLQQMRSMSKDARPKKLPVSYLADFLGISRNTCRDWIQRGHARMGMGAGSDAQQRFAEIYDQFCEVMAEQPVEKLFDVAYNVKSPSQLPALKLILSKVDSAEWGEGASGPSSRTTDTGISDVPRDVIDELNEDELLELERFQQMMAEATEGTAKVLRGAKARVAQRAATGNAEPVEH
jgi:hypothetical protein